MSERFYFLNNFPKIPVAAPRRLPFEPPAAEAPNAERIEVRSRPLSFDVSLPMMVGSNDVAKFAVVLSNPSLLAMFLVKSCVANDVIGLDSAEVLPVNNSVICSIPLAD